MVRATGGCAHAHHAVLSESHCFSDFLAKLLGSSEGWNRCLGLFFFPSSFFPILFLFLLSVSWNHCTVWNKFFCGVVFLQNLSDGRQDTEDDPPSDDLCRWVTSEKLFFCAKHSSFIQRQKGGGKQHMVNKEAGRSRVEVYFSIKGFGLQKNLSRVWRMWCR